jgi:SSS family transporter
MYVGSFAGRVAIAFILLPAFYGGSVTTVYEYLGQRFGPWTRTTASLFFFASRIFGSGIRLLVASLAIAEVFGWPLIWVIAASAGVAVLYATAGGIKAILWTDAFQAAIFTSAAGVAVVFLLLATPGSWQENIAAAYDAGKLHTFNLDWSLSNDKTFWLLTMHAFFTTMAAMGTDQDLTQRMLTCRTVREGRRSLLFNAFAGLPIVCSFLAIGSLLFVYYTAHPAGAVAANEAGERVFPHFIATAMPHNVGLKGLMITAVFAAAMSSLSSAVGALATTAVTDLYKPMTRSERTERHYLAAARVFTFGFGAVLVIVAIAFANSTELLWAVFKWTGLVFGGMLGVFLLGVLTKNRGRDLVNVAAMVSSVVGLVALKLYQDRSGNVVVVWPWWIILGTLWTFAVGGLTATRRQLFQSDRGLTTSATALGAAAPAKIGPLR